MVSSGTFICNKLADFGYKRAINLQKELKETEEQIKHILEKYEIENTTGILPIKLKKTDKNKLSSMDKKRFKKTAK